MTILQKHLVFIPLFCLGYITLFGWIVMALWNCLMPDLFGLSAISFWQAAGLLLLCKILFGGLGAGHHGHGHGNCHHGSNRLRERWENMTPEEREQIIEMHRGCSKAKSETEGNGN